MILIRYMSIPYIISQTYNIILKILYRIFKSNSIKEVIFGTFLKLRFDNLRNIIGKKKMKINVLLDLKVQNLFDSY